jgi:hypothetical protein
MATHSPTRFAVLGLALTLVAVGGCTDRGAPTAPRTGHHPRAALYAGPATMTVTTTGDVGLGSLRHALGNVADGGAIFFDPALAGKTIVVTSPLQIVKSVNIMGPEPGGITVSGGGTTRVFVADGFFNIGLFDMTITGGNATNDPDDADGGALLVRNEALVSLIRVTVSGNTAVRGGGVFLAPASHLNAEHSTISGNTALTDGGGIFNAGFGDGGLVLVYKSTISGNVANGTGGGIVVERAVELWNSTVTFNTAKGGVGGIDFWFNTYTRAFHSVVANNTSNGVSSNCSAFIGYQYDGQGNLSSDDSCGELASVVADPRLGPLANNGGPTQTHALLAGSPAIDAIPPSDEFCGLAPDIDQRGVSRPQGVGCDTGAFELSAADLLRQLTALSSATPGVSNGTQTKLVDAADYVSRGQLRPACNKLKEYIDAVRSQRGKKIAAADADALIALAEGVRALLGC